MSCRERPLVFTLSARSATALEVIVKDACDTIRMNKDMTIRDFIIMMCPDSHNGAISSVETGDGFDCMGVLNRSMKFYLDDMYHGGRVIQMIATIDCIPPPVETEVAQHKNTEVMSSHSRLFLFTLSARSATALEVIVRDVHSTSKINTEMTIRDFIIMNCPGSHNGTISSVETGDGKNCMGELDCSMKFYLDDMYHEKPIHMIATIDVVPPPVE